MSLSNLKDTIWTLRAVLCCCSSCPWAIGGTFAGIYWTMWNEAIAYNETWEGEAFFDDKAAVQTPYDTCGEWSSLGTVPDT